MIQTMRRCEVKLIEYDGEQIRVIEYGGQLWFFASDVARVFQISNFKYYTKVVIKSENKMLVVQLNEWEVVLPPFYPVKGGQKGGRWVVNNAALYEVASRARTKRAKEIRQKQFSNFLENPRNLQAQPKSLSQTISENADFVNLFLKSSKGRVEIEINASGLTEIQKKAIRHIFMELTRYIA